MINSNWNKSYLWVICNKDSSFFHSDTILLYNNVNYYYYSDNCCTFIDWTFYRKNAFVQTKTQICKEPPTSTVATKNDWFTISIQKEQKDIVLETINQDTISRFKVIALDKILMGKLKEETNRIVLVRLK